MGEDSLATPFVLYLLSQALRKTSKMVYKTRAIQWMKPSTPFLSTYCTGKARSLKPLNYVVIIDIIQ